MVAVNFITDTLNQKRDKNLLDVRDRRWKLTAEGRGWVKYALLDLGRRPFRFSGNRMEQLLDNILGSLLISVLVLWASLSR